MTNSAYMEHAYKIELTKVYKYCDQLKGNMKTKHLGFVIVKLLPSLISEYDIYALFQ